MAFALMWVVISFLDSIKENLRRLAKECANCRGFFLLLQIQVLLRECLIYLCLGFLVFHCFKSYQFTELLASQNLEILRVEIEIEKPALQMGAT